VRNSVWLCTGLLTSDRSLRSFRHGSEELRSADQSACVPHARRQLVSFGGTHMLKSYWRTPSALFLPFRDIDRLEYRTCVIAKITNLKRRWASTLPASTVRKASTMESSSRRETPLPGIRKSMRRTIPCKPDLALYTTQLLASVATKIRTVEEPASSQNYGLGTRMKMVISLTRRSSSMTE